MGCHITMGVDGLTEEIGSYLVSVENDERLARHVEGEDGT
jgi:hypothetical protein